MKFQFDWTEKISGLVEIEAESGRPVVSFFFSVSNVKSYQFLQIIDVQNLRSVLAFFSVKRS